MENHNNNRIHHHYNGGGGGREDCWSEGATAVLIEAWGDRYIQLSRGNLRQKDWKDVADAVNGRQDGIKPPRTDIQCKNRVDTIKKKYKLEKSKPSPSQWPFFSRLDKLIGNPTPATSKKIPQFSSSSPLHQKPSAVTFSVVGKDKVYNPNPNLNHNSIVYSGGSSSKSRLNSAESTESSGGDDDDDDEEEEDDDLVFDRSSSRKHHMDRESSDGAGFRELAKAIVKFGEIYERIESSKQQQMMELERQRMKFTKDLEFQRMQMFMEAQLELEKMKRPKYSSSTGESSGLDPFLFHSLSGFQF